MNRTRDYYRHHRQRVIARKKAITRGYWSSTFHNYYPHDGMYSKGKIHCSCWMCAFHGPSISDLRKIEKVSYQEEEAMDKYMEYLLDRKKAVEKEIDRVINACDHNMVEDYGSGSCTKCGYRTRGWYCPNSPDHECDYNQPDGSYDEDCCRYCGEPEERK